MKSRRIALLVFAVVFGIQAKAVELTCPITSKVSATTGNSASQERISKYKFEVRIKHESNGATLSRCGFTPSKNRVTCDEYDVDHIAEDQIWVERNPDDPSEGHKQEYITKYYVYRGQFDVQLFPDGRMIENNGRGSIASGMCGL